PDALFRLSANDTAPPRRITRISHCFLSTTSPSQKPTLATTFGTR
nr:hypothetical protein [Tanacetum cinerariifolium]